MMILVIFAPFVYNITLSKHYNVSRTLMANTLISTPNHTFKIFST